MRETEQKNSHREHKLLLKCPFDNGGWESAEAELFTSITRTSGLACPADIKQEQRSTAKDLQ